MSSKGKVLVAMSGGIDSSIAAVMLREQGYDLTGVTLKTWDYVSACPKKDTFCCSLDSINDAKQIAGNYGFEHFVLDVREEFNKYVVDNFVDEYLSGRTPNPCIMCNIHIKWGVLMKKADELGCDYISTGHYARIREENGRQVLYKGADTLKEQSYVLWGLSQDFLKRTIFPLGGISKQEIRKMADAAGLTNLTDKKESYEICFIPDDDYRGFLNNNVEGLSGKYDGGDFLSVDGKVLGKHKGFPFYTIGQRKGLKIAVGEPLYVIKIIPSTNTVVLGRREDLKCTGIKAGQVNLIKYAAIEGSIEVVTKIRYKDAGTRSILKINGDTAETVFTGEVNAVAPGQSAVFYEGDDVVGGGVILY